MALTRLLRHQRRRSAKLGASDGGVFRYRADEISVYPDDGGLLRIGLGDNNEMVYLLPPPSSTEGWRVVITDGAEWWLFDGPFERFLWELATGGLDCDALPDLSATPVTIEERETYHVYRDGSYHTNWRKLPL